MVSRTWIYLVPFLSVGFALWAQDPASEPTPPLSALEVPKPTLPPLTPQKRGDLYMVRKMYREAIDAYRLAPGPDPVTVNKIGIAYHQLSAFPEARKSYEQAIRIKRDYAEAINNLGTIYYAAKSYRRASSLYRRALRFDPVSASITSNLASAYFSRHMYKEAAEYYGKALELDPEIFTHHNAAGQVIQLRPAEEQARFHYTMAKLYAKSGQNEVALQYLRKALEEGWKDRQRLSAEPEFAGLRESAEFKELLAAEPRVIN